MTGSPVHIALLAALSLGFAAEARALTPAFTGYGSREVVAEERHSAATLSPSYVQSYQYGTSNTGNNSTMIPPSMALQSALRYAPGSQGLGVRLLQGGRLVYAVKLKSGNRIRRILVDARTGQVLGE